MTKQEVCDSALLAFFNASTNRKNYVIASFFCIIEIYVESTNIEGDKYVSN